MNKVQGNKIVCIAGMHRSGTSMVSRMLISCGLYTGSSEKIIPPRPDNSAGFWENVDFVNLNDRILNELGGGWDYFPSSVKEGWENDKRFNHYREIALSIINSFKRANFWGWKDPRNSLTLPFWLNLFPDMKVIVCLRNPLEVATSLQKRNYSSIHFGLKLWEIYNRQLISYVQPEKMILTHYESYFFDAKREMERVLSELGLNVSENQIDNAISTVTRSMRHNDLIMQDLINSGVSNDCLNLYNNLCSKSGSIYNRIGTNESGLVQRETRSKKIVSIVILTHNQIKYTKKCIKSILKHTTSPFELILVDNGSTDTTIKYFEEIYDFHELNKDMSDQIEKKQETKRTVNTYFPFNLNFSGLKIVLNKKNQGFAGGNNRGLKVAKGKYVLLLNNDVVVTPGWLERLIECAENHPKAGIIGPRSNYVSGPQLVRKVEYNPINLEGLEDYAKQFASKNYRKSSRIIRVVGFCMLIKKQVIEKIGGLDSRYGLGNFEDDDFSLRAAISGFESWVAEDCFIHHFGNRTFVGANIDYKESLEKNWELFKEKWGLPKDAAYGSPYSISHIKISSLNPRHHYIPLPVNGDQLYQNKLLNSSGSEQVEINTLLENAIRLFQKGFVEKGVEAFLSGIRRFPADRRVYMSFAEQLINFGRYQDALDALKEMPNESSGYKKTSELQNVDIVLLEGYCQEGLGNYEVASKIAARVLKNQTDHPKALNLRGIVAYRINQKDLAENYFLQAIESDPDYGEAFTNLGSLRWESQDTSEALKLFEQGFSLTPTDLDIAAAYHEAVTELNEFKRAESLVRKVLERFPYSKKIHYILIDVLIKLGKRNESMAQIENTISICGIENGLIEAGLKIRSQIGPAKIKLHKKKRTSVSLCMIVKNEEEFLAQCLASVKPIVDEMIIVDTGSNDRTRDIATVFGARVFDYEWANDFAAARNYSISKAKSEWILIMDADEVFSPIDYGRFRKLTKIKQSGIIAYSIVSRNYCNKANTIGWKPNDGQYAREEAGIGWIPSEKVRLFRNNKEMMFEGAVHEMVDPVLKRLSINAIKSSIPVHHYGSLSVGKVLKKGQLYLDIGNKKLLESGHDINAVRELAIQATSLQNSAEAIELWKKFISMKPGKRNVCEAYINMVTAYIQKREYVNALKCARMVATLFPESKEVQLNLGLAELFNGNTAAALKILEALLDGHPDFPPAQFLFLASKCFEEKTSDMNSDMVELKRSFPAQLLAYSVSGLAEELIAADQCKLALILLQNAIEAEIINKEILNLYANCLEKIKERSRLFDIAYEKGGSPNESIIDCK